MIYRIKLDSYKFVHTLLHNNTYKILSAMTVFYVLSVLSRLNSLISIKNVSLTAASIPPSITLPGVSSDC